MSKEYDQVNFRLLKELNKKADKGAEEMNMSKTAYFTEAVEDKVSVDPFTAKALNRMSETLQLPRSVILGSIFIRNLAELDAQKKVFGRSRELDEFIIMSTGPMAGKSLYRNLFKNFEQKFNLDMVPIKKRRLESINSLINDPDRTAEENKGLITEKAELEAWLKQNDPLLQAERNFNEREALEVDIQAQQDYISQYIKGDDKEK